MITPGQLPFALQGEAVSFVTLTEAQYQAASFLDERILPDLPPATSLGWAEVAAAAAPLGAGCDFLFHVGHVGSTLISRLLGASERVFSLREPAVLRDLATLGAAAKAPTLVKLLARVWRPPQRSLIKVTSFVSEIGPSLMAAADDPRAILLFAGPTAYIAGMLAGEASRRQLTVLAPSRRARLQARLEGRWRGEAFTEGELAAMSWACELTALHEIATRHPGHTLWVDFDQLLGDRREGLARLLRHLHGDAPAPVVEAIMASPDFERYAKAPEHPYDAALRRRVLADASVAHRGEIERGLNWLNALGDSAPGFAAAARAAAAGARA